MYADDTQSNVEFPRGQPVHLTTDTDRISRHAFDVKGLVSRHNRILSEKKTEAIIISTVNNRKLAQPSVDQVIDACGCAVTSKPYITDISVLLDDTRDHASVRLPGMLHTNVGHSNFTYVLF